MRNGIITKVIIIITSILFCTVCHAQKITIIRNYECDSAILGYLHVNNTPICYTLELPWRDNLNDISCIPKGTYSANIRFDKPDKWRIELINVPKRDHVQIHIGNYPSEILGCVLVGTKVDTKKCAVYDSAKAFELLKKKYHEKFILDGSSLDVDIK